MRDRPASSLLIVIVLCVPLVVLGDAVAILLIPWMADLQYALPGFPDDPFGLAGGDRAELAETGIRAIWPLGAGPGLLREANLPGGGAAFTPGEVSHMEDVRTLVRAAATLWVAALVLLTAAIAWLRRNGGAAGSGVVRRGLGLGGLLTFGLIGVAGLLMLIGFDTAFDGFHGIFFEGDSWKFDDDRTLRRLYPDAFWGIAAAALVILALAQATALVLWTGILSRREVLSAGVRAPEAVRRSSSGRSGR